MKTTRRFKSRSFVLAAARSVETAVPLAPSTIPDRWWDGPKPHRRDSCFRHRPQWRGHGDLNSLVNLPGDVRLDTAVAINNHGQVIAYGVSVIPEPEPYVMLLAGLGLVVFPIRRRDLTVPYSRSA